MSEAEWVSDIGADMADADFQDECRADIEEDRLRRLTALKGKYVIVADGRKDLIYLQDQRISKKHYWTKFLNNAISFSDKGSAKRQAAKFKYNNVRVAIVTSKSDLE